MILRPRRCCLGCESDLLECLWARPQGEALPAAAEWREGAARGSGHGLPRLPRDQPKGDSISGLEAGRATGGRRGVSCRHRGVDGRLVTTGGRVLTVTGLGATFAQARARAYAGVAAIGFAGAQHRSDIALRAEEWEPHETRKADAIGAEMAPWWAS